MYLQMLPTRIRKPVLLLLLFVCLFVCLFFRSSIVTCACMCVIVWMQFSPIPPPPPPFCIGWCSVLGASSDPVRFACAALQWLQAHLHSFLHAQGSHAGSGPTQRVWRDAVQGKGSSAEVKKNEFWVFTGLRWSSAIVPVDLGYTSLWGHGGRCDRREG